MFHAQNCVSSELSKFSVCKTTLRLLNEVLVIQGPFNKIQGLLGKIQEFFKDLSKCLNFQGVDAFSRTFQGPCEP